MWKASLVAAALATGLVTVARADHDDRPGPGWISIEQAIAELHRAGYGPIFKVEADDGYWKAKAMKGGVAFKVQLEPRSGRVATSRPDRDDD